MLITAFVTMLLITLVAPIILAINVIERKPEMIPVFLALTIVMVWAAPYRYYVSCTKAANDLEVYGKVKHADTIAEKVHFNNRYCDIAKNNEGTWMIVANTCVYDNVHQFEQPPLKSTGNK